MTQFEELKRSVDVVKQLGGELLKARLDNETTVNVLAMVQNCIWRVETAKEEFEKGHQNITIKDMFCEMLEYVNDDINELKEIYADVLVAQLREESKKTLEKLQKHVDNITHT